MSNILPGKLYEFIGQQQWWVKTYQDDQLKIELKQKLFPHDIILALAKPKYVSSYLAVLKILTNKANISYIKFNNIDWIEVIK